MMRARSLVRYAFPALMLSAAVLAAAATETKAADTFPDPAASWTVAVAAFDTEKLDAAERLSGDLVAGKLAPALFGVGNRRYPDAERDAYIRYLGTKALEAAVKELAAKRAARDALLFAGLADWKYEAELKKADEAVRIAITAFEAAFRARPEVAPEKPVKSAKENDGRVYFTAPKKGEERSFCVQHAYDALLLGRVESFYGRAFVSIRLYSPFLNRDLYADEATFSAADREPALAELSGRLAAAASGLPPALLSVRVEPGEADVLLDGLFAGVGSAGPIERGPGIVRVEAERGGCERFEEKVELFPGERAQIDIELPSIPSNRLTVEAFGVSDGKEESPSPSDAAVRLNGLYVGGSPFEISIPKDRFAYVQVEGSDKKTASAVIKSTGDGTVPLLLTEPLPKDARPTEDARRAFYGAFGRFSLFMPIAFFVSGIASSYESAAVVYNSTELSDLTGQVRFAASALWTVSGVFAAESIFRFVRYLRNSGMRAVKKVPIDI